MSSSSEKEKITSNEVGKNGGVFSNIRYDKSKSITYIQYKNNTYELKDGMEFNSAPFFVNGTKYIQHYKPIGENGAESYMYVI